MAHNITKRLVPGAVLLLGMAVNIFAAGGILDGSFNGTGKSIFNMDSDTADGYFTDVAVIAGNKFLAAGRVVISSGYYAVTLSRFNSDGSLDTSFGSGGKVVTDTGADSNGVALAVQSDGKIVVLGALGSSPFSAVVLRYTPDGVLDTTFGNNGLLFSPIKQPQEIVVLADDKILISGKGDVPNTDMDGVQIAKFNANGSADTSFGVNGIASSQFNWQTSAERMTIQSDGKIVVSGDQGIFVANGIVHRFNADGSPDSTFDSDGVREIVGPSNWRMNVGGGLAIQPDGKIVLAGSGHPSGFGNSQLALVRLNSDGSSDTSFGTQFGMIFHELTADDDGAIDMVLQSDGKIVISGQQDSEFAIVARFTSTGAKDTGFGNNGVNILNLFGRYAMALSLQGSNVVTVGIDHSGPFLARVDQAGATLTYRVEPFLVGKNDEARDVAVQPDGKIVAVGSTTNTRGDPYLAVSRLLPNGSLDPAFGTGGRVVVYEGAGSSEGNAVDIQPDGKILIAGRYSSVNFSSYHLYVVRLNADGSLDGTFGNGGRAVVSGGGAYLLGHDMELQPDGKIVVGGRAERWIGDGIVEYDMIAARLNTNGTPDSGFGTNGVFIYFSGSPTALQREHARALSILPSGKIILAGTHFLRLESNGTVDATFSPTPIPLGYTASDIKLQPDGKMVTSALTSSDFILFRYNANASLDTSFGNNGNSTLDIGGADGANAIYLEPNGNIVAGGFSLGGSPSRRKFALARFRPNGSPDPDFGSGGKVVTDLGGDAEIFGVARQNDGKTVAAGFAKTPVDRDFAVARYFSRSAIFDFDGDSKSDISIFRPSVGEWWILKSSNGGNAAYQFGNSSDRIVPADFTGDGKTDVAIFRPSTGEWFVLRSEDSSYYSFPFGLPGDLPAAGDFDGDGKADPAIFRPSNATWYVSKSGGGTIIEQFGLNGDVPAVADYDGDGKADIAIWRATWGQWWIKRSSLGILAFDFGNSADKPVPGDYTGDGKTDVAIYRPSTGEWFVLRSEDLSYYSFPFGLSTDIPAAGDYDGDGKFDATVFRPSNNTWYSQRSTAGLLIQSFGQAGDKPVPSAFVP